MFAGTRGITPLLAAIPLASCANMPEPPTNSHVGTHPYSAAELERAFENSRSALPRDLYGPLGAVIDASRQDPALPKAITARRLYASVSIVS